MGLTVEQLTERQTYIGGSDVGAILGLNPFRSPRDVYHSKSKDIEESGSIERLEWGWLLEEPIALEFERRTGLEVVKDDKVYRDPEFDFLGGMVDRVILGKAPNNEPGLLEIKLASRNSFESWEDDYPPWYYAQVQHYLMITGFEYAYIAILVEAAELKISEIKRDDPFIAIMREVCINFWKEHVEKGIEPELTISDDLKEAFSDPTDTSIEASNEVYDDVKEFEKIRAERIALEKLEEKKKKELALAIGNHTKMTYDGKLILTYKQTHKDDFNKKSFKETYLELYQKFVYGNSFRTFRIPK